MLRRFEAIALRRVVLRWGARERGEGTCSSEGEENRDSRQKALSPWGTERATNGVGAGVEAIADGRGWVRGEE